jgi:GrpB-like predicted nucleotidyltransferase (UPF0157 family)
MAAPIVLADPDPTWPARYVRLAERIGAALGERVVVLEHVGSTSVPELAAKPIIDILLLVPHIDDEATYVPALEAAGFRFHLREPDWYAHRLFKGTDIAANLHVFGAGSEEAHRMLAFRDRLRTDPVARQRYEDTKRLLAAREWETVQDYADAKTDIVRSLTM